LTRVKTGRAAVRAGVKSRAAAVPRLTLFAADARLFVRAAHNLKDWEMNSSTRREVAG